MKQKIEEKTKKLQQIIETINNGRNQINELEKEGLMIQGEIRLLKQMESEKPKKVIK